MYCWPFCTDRGNHVAARPHAFHAGQDPVDAPAALYIDTIREVAEQAERICKAENQDKLQRDQQYMFFYPDFCRPYFE